MVCAVASLHDGPSASTVLHCACVVVAIMPCAQQKCILRAKVTELRVDQPRCVAGFWGVTGSIVVGCAYVFVAIMRYTQKKRIL
jgi:hypothetical protein